ncbi:MAG: hypothetical protein U9R44_02605 [Candidatus Omnitrophota bacterium]|nr:hypothetical protein [Candidatus Omnitrophota bacterium]
MRKMNLAEGVMVFLGFMLLLNIAILKFKGINLLEQVVKNPGTLLLAANTCFVLAFVVAVFGREKKSE